MKIKSGHLVFAAAFLLLCHGARAQESFEQLPASEKSLLKAAMQVWPQLDAGARSQLRAQARHWSKLSPAEQQTLLLKQRQWDGLSFADKSSERARYAAWQSLGAIDQAKVSAAYRQWRMLPVEKQQALRAKFAQQLPEYRQAWIFGPTLGSEAQMLQDWMLFTPQDQIRPWLMILRQLAKDDRAVLIDIGRRWNQQKRDTFRSRLLSAPAGARSDMIQNATR